MVIPIRFGTIFYGHLEQDDGEVLATRVFHLWYLPLIPLGTYRMFGDRGLPAPFSFKSLFAAFFKPWGFILACALAGVGLDQHWSYDPDALYLVLASAALFVAVFASWLFLGHRLQPGNKRVFVVPILAVLTLGFLGTQIASRLPTRGAGLQERTAQRW